MKIVFLHDDFPPESVGGAGMAAATLAQQLQKQGHDVSVITTTPHEQNAGVGTWEGVSAYRIYSSYHERWRAWRSLYNPAVVHEVRRLLNELKPQVVHAHNVHYHLSYAVLAVAKHAGAKVFLTAHDAMLVSYGKLPTTGIPSAWRDLYMQKLRYNPFRNFFIRRGLKNLSGLFTVSEALRGMLERQGIRVTAVVCNSIDVAEWDIKKETVAEFIRTHGLSGKKIIFFGGRISPLKGDDALVAGLPAIVRAVPETVLLVAGKENDHVRMVRKHAQELGVGGAIVCTGWLSGDDLKAAYHASTIVVQPSIYFEPFGLIALEGMACGKPVVVGCKGGLPEVVQDGGTGYVVDPHNTEQLSSRIIKLVSDTALAEKMGRAARRRAQDRFSLERQASSVLAWYRSLR